MTRFLGRPDSVFGGNPGFLADGILNGYITGNVAAGELCTIFESGVIRRTDPSLPWAAINCDGGVVQVATPAAFPVCTTIPPVCPDPAIIQLPPIVAGGYNLPGVSPASYLLLGNSFLNPPGLITNLSCATQTVSNCCGLAARLTDGTYVVPVQTPTGIGFIVRSSAGQQLANFFTINNDVSVTIPHCLPLANGAFVIIWLVSSTLKHCVVTPTNGSYVLATITTITSICASSNLVPWFGHCPLGNGNFVVTYTTTGGILQGAIYTALGVIVGSVFTIDSTCTQTHHACSPCANGDFLHYGFDTAHNLFKIYRITNTGSVVWGPITPAGCGTSVFSQPDAPRIHPQFNRVIELGFGVGSHPNFCVSLPNGSGYCNQFVLRGDTGALINQCDIGNQFHDVNFHNAICATPRGFCVGHTLSAQPNTFCSFFDFNGYPIHTNILLDTGAHLFPAVNSPICHSYLGFVNNSVCLSRYARDNLGNVEVRCLNFDVAGNILCPPFAIQPFGPSDCNSPIPICDTDGSIFVCHFTSGPSQCVTTCLKIGRSSVIGVAQAAATNGQAVTITSEGYFNLPSSQIFGPGVAFDRRQSLPNGARGVVGGQVAILFGWV